MSLLRRSCRILAAVAVVAFSGLSLSAETPLPQQQVPRPQTAPPAGQTPAASAKKHIPPPSGFAPLVNRPGQAWEEKYMQAPVVGKVFVYVPKQPTTHVVLFLSGDGGWNLGVVDMARRFANRAVVVGISYVALKKVGRSGLKCWLVAGDLEEIAHGIEKALALPEYHAPILVGYSSGATAVFAAIAGGPPTTFAGAMSLGFCPDLPSNVRVCDNGDWKPTFDAKKNTAWLPRTDEVPHEWYVLHGVEDQVCSPPDTEKFLAGTANVHFITVEHTGHGFANQARWVGPFDDSIAKLLAADAPPTTPVPSSASAAEIQHQLESLTLPLNYVWADKPRAAMIFVSGDGGWAAIDQGVASDVSARGISVVGLSTVKYFWSKKTPEQTGADLKRIADILSAAGYPLIFGGYSFGAEVTPFALATWPPADRRRVLGQVLIGPGETASFEVSVLDWVRTAKATPMVVAHGVKALKLPTLCVFGTLQEASDTACDDMAGAADAVQLPGSHHFNGKYDDVASAVMTFVDKHVGAAPIALHVSALGPRLPSAASQAGSRTWPVWIAISAAGAVAAAFVVRKLRRGAQHS